MSHVDDAVAACRDLLEAREAMVGAVSRREAAWRGMVTDGTPKRRVGWVTRQGLTAAGFTVEEVAAAGVSDGNVAVALR